MFTDLTAVYHNFAANSLKCLLADINIFDIPLNFQNLSLAYFVS